MGGKDPITCGNTYCWETAFHACLILTNPHSYIHRETQAWRRCSLGGPTEVPVAGEAPGWRQPWGRRVWEQSCESLSCHHSLGNCRTQSRLLPLTVLWSIQFGPPSSHHGHRDSRAYMSGSQMCTHTHGLTDTVGNISEKLKTKSKGIYFGAKQFGTLYVSEGSESSQKYILWKNYMSFKMFRSRINRLNSNFINI